MTKPKPRPTSCEGCGGELSASPRVRRFCSKPCADKQYRVDNIEKCRAGSRQWQTDNPDRSRAIKKKYADANRAEINTKARERADYSAAYARNIERHGRETVLNTIRTASLKRRFGLTPEEYDALLESQGGGCAICGKTPEENGRRLAVDHDHACCPDRTTCGKCVRGLLCTADNNHLGIVENAEWLAAATMYLDVHRRAAV